MSVHPPHIVSPALARHARHGFFGRKGGVSTACHAGLNVGTGSLDDAGRVRENRLRIARALGSENGLVTARQAHTANALYIDDPRSDKLDEPADALVTQRPGLVIGVVTADCIPILICDPQTGTIAAVHAGWRGSLAGIVEAALAIMVDERKADPDDCIAVIGPALGRESFEVGPELVAAFTASHPWSEELFAPGKDDRSMFDHNGFVCGLLDRAGVGLIETLDFDTMKLQEEYFSYRRARKQGQRDYGRNGAAIVLLE